MNHRQWLPLGVFIAAVAFDAIYLWRESSMVAAVGPYLIARDCAGQLEVKRSA
jgi:uncharacterized membrane protein